MRHNHYAFALARYNTDGSLDSTFVANGTTRNNINGGNSTDDEANSVAIQSDGKIVAAGYSQMCQVIMPSRLPGIRRTEVLTARSVQMARQEMISAAEVIIMTMHFPWLYKAMERLSRRVPRTTAHPMHSLLPGIRRMEALTAPSVSTGRQEILSTAETVLMTMRLPSPYSQMGRLSRRVTLRMRQVMMLSRLRGTLFIQSILACLERHPSPRPAQR